MEAAVGGLLGALLGFGLTVLIGRLSDTTGRLERKLDLLLRHAAIDVPRVAADEAAALARAGKKIEAIKVYRGYTGCGLAEAKARVEGLA